MIRKGEGYPNYRAINVAPHDRIEGSITAGRRHTAASAVASAHGGERGAAGGAGIACLTQTAVRLPFPIAARPAIVQQPFGVGLCWGSVSFWDTKRRRRYRGSRELAWGRHIQMRHVGRETGRGAVSVRSHTPAIVEQPFIRHGHLG